MAVGDFFKLTMFSSLHGEQLVNVWHYRQDSPFAGNAAQALVDAFQAIVTPKIAFCQSDLVTYTRILAQNLVTLSENFEDVTPTPSGGARAQPSLPPLLAFALRSTRPDLSKRYSYKRFAGATPDVVTGETWTAPFLADMTILAQAMDDVLSPGFGDFRPVQLKLVYDLLGNPVYTLNYVITAWDAQALATTQNSRKQGHGD